MLKNKIHLDKKYTNAKYLLFTFPLVELANLLFNREYYLRASLSELLQALAAIYTSILLYLLIKDLKNKNDQSFNGWNLIFISSIFWALGMISFLIIRIYKINVPYPNYSDFFFVLSYMPLVLGILKLPVEKKAVRNKLLNILDVLSFFIVSLLVVWHFNLRFIFENLTFGIKLDLITSFVYTFLDIAVLNAIFLKLSQNLGEGKYFIPTLLLILGGFFLTTADILQGYETVEGFFFSGSILDLGWVLFSTFTGFAAIKLIYLPKVDYQSDQKSFIKSQYWILGITSIWIAIVFSLMIWVILIKEQINYFLLIAASLGAIFLIVSRQFLTLKENILLSEQLKSYNLRLQEEILRQKESEKKVRQALEKEKELNELKTRFISIASHEFRTPLATMHSSIELLEAYRENINSEKSKALYDRIKKGIYRLTEIMNDIFKLSQIDSEKISFVPEQINLKNFIEDIIEENIDLFTSNHKIITEFPADNIIITVDSRLFKIILVNLISNAVKFSPDGGNIKIRIFESGELVKISISDQGIGIPESNLKNIFSPFSRADNVGNINGIGLGLTIVKKYVELHKGTITVETELNKGTSFTINLPLKQKSNEEEKDFSD